MIQLHMEMLITMLKLRRYLPRVIEYRRKQNGNMR